MSKMKTVEDASENIDIREGSQQYASGGRQRGLCEKKNTLNSTESKTRWENGEDSDFDPIFGENDAEAGG